MNNHALILVDWFAPAYKAGGIITAVKNFAKQLSKTNKVFIVTSDCDINNEQLKNISVNTWTLYGENCFVKYVPKKDMTPAFITQTVNTLKPDRIYLNGMFSFRFTILPLYLLLRKKITCEVMVYAHGMMMPEALRQKALKKTIFLRLFRMLKLPHKITLQTNMSVEYEQMKKRLNPPEGRLVMEPMALPEIKDHCEVIDKNPGYVSLAFVGRIHPSKNLDYALRVLEKLPYDIEYNIVGTIEDDAYWNECKKIIERLPSNIRVKYRGTVPQEQVTSLLNDVHALFLPSRTENFCFAIYESLITGRPVITSDQTPWRDLVHKEAGWDLPLSEFDSFVDAVEHMAMMGQNEFSRMVNGAHTLAICHEQATAMAS
jgi:glycosyltransferase involved in cell wall biosynthesis